MNLFQSKNCFGHNSTQDPDFLTQGNKLLRSCIIFECFLNIHLECNFAISTAKTQFPKNRNCSFLRWTLKVTISERAIIYDHTKVLVHNYEFALRFLSTFQGAKYQKSYSIAALQYFDLQYKKKRQKIIIFLLFELTM